MNSCDFLQYIRKAKLLNAIIYVHLHPCKLMTLDSRNTAQFCFMDQLMDQLTCLIQEHAYYGKFLRLSSHIRSLKSGRRGKRTLVLCDPSQAMIIQSEHRFADTGYLQCTRLLS